MWVSVVSLSIYVSIHSKRKLILVNYLDSSIYAHYVFKAFDVNSNGAISFRVSFRFRIILIFFLSFFFPISSLFPSSSSSLPFSSPFTLFFFFTFVIVVVVIISLVLLLLYSSPFFISQLLLLLLLLLHLFYPFSVLII